MKQLGVHGLLWLKRWMGGLKDEKGVTLIELLAVVVILAIISAVAVPTVMGQITKSKFNADQSTESIIVDALTRAEFDYQSSANSTGLIYLSTATIGTNSTPTTGLLLNATKPAEVFVGNNKSSENVTDLLVNGAELNDNSSFVSAIPKPNMGADWAISTATSNNTSVPSTSFSFSNNSNGASGTYYLYPVG